MGEWDEWAVLVLVPLFGEFLLFFSELAKQARARSASVTPQLTVRQEQHRSEVSVLFAHHEVAAKRLVEGNLRGLEEGALVDVQHAAAKSATAQDDDVAHGAFAGLDGAKRRTVAVRGLVADGDERVGRALSARRQEKAARLPELISAARPLRGHQEPDGVLRLIGLPRDLWHCMQEARHVRGAWRRGRESS